MSLIVILLDRLIGTAGMAEDWTPMEKELPAELKRLEFMDDAKVPEVWLDEVEELDEKVGDIGRY